MTCLGGCGDCNCKEVNLCESTEKINDQMLDSVKKYKDFECEIRKTPCNNTIEAISRLANGTWCILNNLNLIGLNTMWRTDNLCETQKCIIEKLKEMSKVIALLMTGNVEFSMSSKTSTDDSSTTTMDSKTNSDGTFQFHWNTHDGQKNIGDGFITGKVTHSYESNIDGSVKVKVSSLTINNVKWDKKSENSAANKNISIHIKDLNGNSIYDKNYDGSVSWSETINKTIPLNIERDLEPLETTGDIQVLSIDDNWILNTHGNASVNYRNNNRGGKPPIISCQPNCDKCSNPNRLANSIDSIALNAPIDYCEPKNPCDGGMKYIAGEGIRIDKNVISSTVQTNTIPSEKYDDSALKKRLDELEKNQLKLLPKTITPRDLEGYNFYQDPIKNAEALAPYVKDFNLQLDDDLTTSSKMNYELVLVNDIPTFRPIANYAPKVIGYSDNTRDYKLDSYMNGVYSYVDIETDYRGNIYIMLNKDSHPKGEGVEVVDKTQFSRDFTIFTVRLKKDKTRIKF